MTPHRSSIDLARALVVTGGLLAGAAAAADVTIVTQTTTTGIGGFGNTTGTETRVISKDRERSESDSKYEGRFKTFAGGPSRTTRIVRLDQGVVWELNDVKKTYTELTFDEMRAQMQRAAEQLQQAQGKMQQAKAEAAEKQREAGVDMKWDVDVKKTGEKQTIAGFDCERAIVTCTSTLHSDKPEQAKANGSGMKYVMDEWLSAKTPGAKEAREFEKAYAEKLGLQQYAAQIAPQAAAMYGDAVSKMADKLKDVSGYPMKVTFTVEPLETQEMKEKMAEANAKQKDAQAEEDKAEKKSEAAENASDAASVGGAAANHGHGLSGAIGGFFAHKMANAAAKKAKENAEKSAATSGNPNALFTSVTEVTSVSGDVASGSFDLPAGYKKVEAPRASKE